MSHHQTMIDRAGSILTLRAIGLPSWRSSQAVAALICVSWRRPSSPARHTLLEYCSFPSPAAYRAGRRCRVAWPDGARASKGFHTSLQWPAPAIASTAGAFTEAIPSTSHHRSILIRARARVRSRCALQSYRSKRLRCMVNHGSTCPCRSGHITSHEARAVRPS